MKRKSSPRKRKALSWKTQLTKTQDTLDEHVASIKLNEAKLEQALRKRKEDTTRALLAAAEKVSDSSREVASFANPILSQVVDEAMQFTAQQLEPLGSFGKLIVELVEARKRKQETSLAEALAEAEAVAVAARTLAVHTAPPPPLPQQQQQQQQLQQQQQQQLARGLADGGSTVAAGAAKSLDDMAVDIEAALAADAPAEKREQALASLRSRRNAPY